MSELDWNRLRSGDYRALDPEHQDAFNMVAAKDAEIERLLKCIRWHRSQLWGKHSIGHPADIALYRETIGDE